MHTHATTATPNICFGIKLNYNMHVFCQKKNYNMHVRFSTIKCTYECVLK